GRAKEPSAGNFASALVRKREKFGGLSVRGGRVGVTPREKKLPPTRGGPEWSLMSRGINWAKHLGVRGAKRQTDLKKKGRSELSFRHWRNSTTSKGRSGKRAISGDEM